MKVILDPSIVFHPLFGKFNMDMLKGDGILLSPALHSYLTKKDTLFPGDGINRISDLWKIDETNVAIAIKRFEIDQWLIKCKDNVGDSRSILPSMETSSTCLNFYQYIYSQLEEYSEPTKKIVFEMICLSLNTEEPILCSSESEPKIVGAFRKCGFKIVSRMDQYCESKSNYLKEKGVKEIIKLALGTAFVHCLGGPIDNLIAFTGGQILSLIVDP